MCEMLSRPELLVSDPGNNAIKQGKDALKVISRLERVIVSHMLKKIK